MEIFKMRKKCKDKDLIWHMVGEMVKKQGSARLFISCNYSCAFYFLVKILLVKLKNHHTSACLKLNYCATKHKPKMKRLQRWWNLSKPVTNTLVSFGNFFNSIRNGQFLSAWGITIKTCGRVLLGDKGKIEQIQFFDALMYLQ